MTSSSGNQRFPLPKAWSQPSAASETGSQASATGAPGLFEMPWQALTGGRFPVVRARYFSLLSRRQIVSSPPTAAKHHVKHPAASRGKWVSVAPQDTGNVSHPADVKTPETRPAPCECTALASGERQARKGVVTVPSRPRRPRVLHSEGRDDHTTVSRPVRAPAPAPV